MATLTADGFSLRLTIIRAKDGWLVYKFGIFCETEPVLNYRIYKGSATNTPKKHRPEGARAWSISETLIPTLQWILDNNRALCWESTEPDARLAVYPDDSFPLAPAHHEVIVAGENESPFDRSTLSKLEVNQRKLFIMDPDDEPERPAGPCPEDPFCVILHISSNKFVGSTYTDTGPAIILQTTRRAVTRFLRDIKREYKTVPKRKEPPRKKQVSRQR